MIRKNGILYWRIPNGIELSTSLNLFPPRIRKKKPKVDVFYYILDEITKRTFRSSKDQKEGFVEIHSTIFLRFHHDYKDYMDYLISHKFIERDEEFIVDEKSYGYRINLNEINFENPFQEIPIKDELIRKKQESNECFKEIFSNAQSDYSHLTKWFNSSLKIDDKRAIKKIKQLYHDKIQNEFITKKERNEALNKLFKNLCVIEEIKNHDFYCEVDNNIGRFHSNLTNLKKELRPFITYEGRNLVNIDIRNSQPLLSTVLFNQWFWDKKSTKLNIYKIPTAMNIMLGYEIDKQQVKEHGMRWYTGIENMKYKVEGNILSVTFFLKSLNREHMEYISFCFSSKFYKKVWDKVFPGRQFDKPKAKKIFYQYIYSSNMGYQWEDKVSISQAFPKVSEFFNILKHPDYVLLSHIMQRLESVLMIEVVSRRIAAEKPGIPIFTIHDSIVTLPEEVDYVKQVIKEEFKRYLDLNVKLGKENWY